jgi:hypothetical protein
MDVFAWNSDLRVKPAMASGSSLASSGIKTSTILLMTNKCPGADLRRIDPLHARRERFLWLTECRSQSKDTFSTDQRNSLRSSPLATGVEIPAHCADAVTAFQVALPRILSATSLRSDFGTHAIAAFAGLMAFPLAMPTHDAEPSASWNARLKANVAGSFLQQTCPLRVALRPRFARSRIGCAGERRRGNRPSANELRMPCSIRRSAMRFRPRSFSRS